MVCAPSHRLDNHQGLGRGALSSPSRHQNLESPDLGNRSGEQPRRSYPTAWGASGSSATERPGFQPRERDATDRTMPRIRARNSTPSSEMATKIVGWRLRQARIERSPSCKNHRRRRWRPARCAASRRRETPDPARRGHWSRQPIESAQGRERSAEPEAGVPRRSSASTRPLRGRASGAARAR